MSANAAARDDYERLHASLDDANLDAIAGIAGCVPAIGRLNYLDDGTLASLTDRMSLADGSRVLDLGCGRGFLGRWLFARGHRVAYTAMDYSHRALESVARHLPNANVLHGELDSLKAESYDAIFAIESVSVVGQDLAARLRAATAPSGCAAICISSLDASHDRRVDATVEALRNEGFDVQRIAFAAGHAETVGRLCAALLIEPPVDSWARDHLTAEAARTLAALRDGVFRSDLLLAVLHN